MTREPIAYAYDADVHCRACAQARFGQDDNGFISGEDSEHNEIGAVFSWDDWWEPTDTCGTCGNEIGAA